MSWKSDPRRLKWRGFLIRTVTLLLTIVWAATIVVAQSTPTIDELIGLEGPREVAISADGRTVAYVVETTNWDEDRYEREIWLAQEGAPPLRLSGGSRSSYRPRFSPDGRSLAFISDRTETPQLYRISLGGGEAEALTDREGGVSDFAWAPDGSFLVLRAVDEKSDGLKEREEKFGAFSWEDEDHRMEHLWKLGLGSSGEEHELVRLTSGDDFTVGDFDLSPDGKTIAFSARPSPDPRHGMFADLYVLTLATRQFHKIVGWAGAEGSPRFSPGGDRIAFVTGGGVASYYRNRELGVVPAEGGDVAILTSDFDEHPSLLSWREDGLYFRAGNRTERHLFRIEDDGSGLTRLTGDGWVVGGAAVARDADRMAFIGDRFDRFTEVYRVAFDAQPEPVTDFDRQLDGFDLSDREVIRWKSTDGVTIEGVLLKPRDFDPQKKYPLLFKIHGGPTGVDTRQKLTGSDRRYYPLERFVAKGALVLMVNYRGSGGYGEAFRSLNVRNLGVGDEWDVLSGLDHLLEEGYVDAERVGTMGWSQGGYISAFLSTHSGRFAAASVGAGISNWMTYYVNTDIHPFTRQYLQATPWDDPEIYAKTSPITYIKEAKTPTLIQHGEKDARVPIPNAFELYQGLRDQDVPVRLAVYGGFGHGITKPKSNRAVMTHNEEWFTRWIWAEGETSSMP